jgi:hypothetical protein
LGPNGEEKLEEGMNSGQSLRVITFHMAKIYSYRPTTTFVTL